MILFFNPPTHPAPIHSIRSWKVWLQRLDNNYGYQYTNRNRGRFEERRETRKSWFQLAHWTNDVVIEGLQIQKSKSWNFNLKFQNDVFLAFYWLCWYKCNWMTTPPNLKFVWLKIVNTDSPLINHWVTFSVFEYNFASGICVCRYASIIANMW